MKQAEDVSGSFNPFETNYLKKHCLKTEKTEIFSADLCLIKIQGFSQAAAGYDYLDSLESSRDLFGINQSSQT